MLFVQRLVSAFDDGLAGLFGEAGEGGGRVVGVASGIVPEDGAAVLGVGELGDFFASGDAEIGGFDLEAHPLAEWRQVAGAVVMAFAVVRYGFEIAWEWQPAVLMAALGATVVLSIVAGLAASARALAVKPLAVLRREE